jgi:hypothetical protein
MAHQRLIVGQAHRLPNKKLAGDAVAETKTRQAVRPPYNFSNDVTRIVGQAHRLPNYANAKRRACPAR